MDPPYGGSANTDLCRSFKLGLVPTLLYLGGGAWSCFCGYRWLWGVNLHSQSQEDSATVEDSFTQTLVQSLKLVGPF